MGRKLTLSGMAALALVLTAGIAMAQQNPNYNDNAKPGGKSTWQPQMVSTTDAAKPGGASTRQIPMSEHDTANKPGGASTTLPVNH